MSETSQLYCPCDPTFSPDVENVECESTGCLLYSIMNIVIQITILSVSIIFVLVNYYSARKICQISSSTHWMERMKIAQNKLYALLIFGSLTRFIRFVLIVANAEAHIIVYGILYVILHLIFLSGFSILTINWVTVFYRDHRSNEDTKVVLVIRYIIITLNIILYIGGLLFYIMNELLNSDFFLLMYDVMIGIVFVALSISFLLFAGKLYRSIPGRIINIHNPIIDRFRMMTRLLFILASSLIMVIILIGLFLIIRRTSFEDSEKLFLIRHSLYRFFELVVAVLMMMVMGWPTLYIEWRKNYSNRSTIELSSSQSQSLRTRRFKRSQNVLPVNIN